MLRRIWQQLRRTPPKPSPNQEQGANLTSPLTNGEQREGKIHSLRDAGYEQVFLQLLDGVHEGWSRGDIRGFLIAKRINQSDFVAWLQQFGERLRQAAQPNEELAERMVRLSQVGSGELGEVAGEIGRDLLSKSAKLAPTNSLDSADIDEAEAWFNRGNQQLMRGDFLSAVASFDQALHFKPDDHDAWHSRGVALRKLGRFEKAIASYDQALHCKPDHHDAWSSRGFALVNLGRFEEAIAS